MKEFSFLTLDDVETFDKRILLRVDINSPIIFTGGVARNSGMKDALEIEFGSKIEIPTNPTTTGALGAAILATK